MNIEKIFREIGILKQGHFLLHSGLHSNLYFEKFRLIEQPEYAGPLFELLAGHFKEMNISTVAGPTTGGAIIAFEIAKILKKRCIIAEKLKHGRDFLRGRKVRPDENILIVDDVLTTGSSIQDVISAIKKYKGNLCGVGVVIDRSVQTPDFGVPVYSVYRRKVENFTSENCPYCKAGLPLIRPGGGR
ncbi:orotate phosphoribosyltransferase [candidate division WOR-3 bacterium]|nr:orotate phosphoribosyltransferase [candidate division WOR-3 bacterium]